MVVNSPGFRYHLSRKTKNRKELIKMNQEKFMKKILAAGITNEAVSAEDAMEQMIKEKNRVLQIGKSFVIYDPNGKIMRHTAAGFKKE